MRRRVVWAALVVLVAGLLSGCDTTPPPDPDAYDVSCPAFGAPDLAVSKADALPDATLRCLGRAGGTVDLAGAPGKPVVLNFWASWCGPCRDELDLLEQLHTDTDGVLVLGVATKDTANAEAFAAEKKLTFPVVEDPDAQLLTGRDVQVALPVTILLDATGKVVDTRIGAFTSYQQLRTTVQEKLGV